MSGQNTKDYNSLINPQQVQNNQVTSESLPQGKILI